MKYLFSILFLLAGLFVQAQTIVSDTTFFEIANNSNFVVRVIDWSDGTNQVTKTKVPSIPSEFKELMAKRCEVIARSIANAQKFDDRVNKWVRENNRVANQAGYNLVDSNSVKYNAEILDSLGAVVQQRIIGAWTLNDFDRTNAITITFNPTNLNLRYTSSVGNGQIFLLAKDLMYWKGWRGKGLILTTLDGGVSWCNISGNIKLIKA